MKTSATVADEIPIEGGWFDLLLRVCRVAMTFLFRPDSLQSSIAGLVVWLVISSFFVFEASLRVTFTASLNANLGIGASVFEGASWPLLGGVVALTFLSRFFLHFQACLRVQTGSQPDRKLRG